MRKMEAKIQMIMGLWVYFLVCFSLILTSCAGNFFKDLSGKDSPEALYQEALKYTDSANYDAAFTQLTAIESKYPDYASSDTFKKTKGGVQAGQCGLNFINLISGLSAAAGGQVFSVLMQAFKGVVVVPQKCVDSQATMATLSTTSNDQLLFMAVLGMAKVGTFLRDRADRTNTTGDGAADATFDTCDPTTAADRLNDADMKEVITGFGLILQNFTLIGGTFAGSSASSSIAALNAFCFADAINCSVTDVNNVSAQMVRIFRRIIQSKQYGIKTCDLTALVFPPDCCPALAIP